MSNLTIDFQGSDLYFTNMLASGLFLYNCTGLTLQNLTMDYQPVPFTQVQVVSVNPQTRQIQYALQSGWRDPAALSAAIGGGTVASVVSSK